MKFKSLLVLIILFTKSAFAQTALPEADFQFWNETQITVPVINAKDKNGRDFERLALFLSGTLRFGRNYTRFVDERIGAGLDFKINRYLTFTPSYLYRAAQPYRNRREFENRLRLALTVENKWKKFSLRDRNMFEHRLRNSRADALRYRNKLQFIYPVHKDNKETFAPFIYDEVFYDFQDKTLTRNELTIGINKKFTPGFSADFFYVYQRNRGNVLRDVNALGINLKYKIDWKNADSGTTPTDRR
jgi:hypothetical protein